ncbi:MAG: ABC transporter permease [Alistipes sp.]|jgi:putative ABC transport system permease protein|nr:ABC transporter permease [Alistipes sp.]
MRFFDTDSFNEIWATITRNRFRSVATGFGVFWGLFMLIVLLAIGNKLTQSILSQVDGFATNSVMIFSGRTSEPYKGYRKGRSWDMDNGDVELIRQKATTVDIISPIMMRGSRSDRNVVRGMKGGSWSYSGIYPNYFDINKAKQESGRSINDIDITERRKVCVIGQTVYETLFAPGEVAEGQFIRLNGIYLQVIGVISPHSRATIGGPVDESIFLPFTTQQMLFERDLAFDMLAVTAVPGVSASVAEEEVKTLLRAAHDIAPTDTKAVESFNLEVQFKTIQLLFVGLAALMWMVGLGALLSGIIGVSNIMLVTVRERMREIGVRRALGARPWDVIAQIMSESFVLTAIAGMLGFMCGVAASLLVDKIDFSGGNGVLATIHKPVVSFDLALAAMTVLIVSGLVAGLLPAMKALTIKAIDAIRDE